MPTWYASCNNAGDYITKEIIQNQFCNVNKVYYIIGEINSKQWRYVMYIFFGPNGNSPKYWKAPCNATGPYGISEYTFGKYDRRGGSIVQRKWSRVSGRLSKSTFASRAIKASIKTRGREGCTRVRRQDFLQSSPAFGPPVVPNHIGPRKIKLMSERHVC